ncbi:multidrug ABC transporter ATP-binding protein [Lottiidibacillus patelloidae]|uniref:Multidrug ABC transporter ATP-binding protein n=1 Tax=Lottiidibacillus patelloidae TaxID=2670334 RepID=A0A263BTD6_9BACI|nr:ABC transporter ATP-binding protein [Lottiidibacillus patelloidae]OZM56980.1 multidrug ABC transporter ATP-binding protein [Lottiidibacillus patelloidae]
MRKQLREPFQYEKIPLSEIKSPKKKKKKAKDTLGTLKRIWNYLSYKKAKLFLVLAMVIVSSVLGLLGPLLIGSAIDNYIVPQKTDGLLFILLLLAGVYVFFGVFVLLQNFVMIGVAQETIYRMRRDLFSHLQKLSLPFFDKRQHGELMSRVTNDIDNISSTLNSSVIQIFSSILTLIGTVSIMFWLSPLLTLITMTIVPLIFVGIKWITRRTQYIFKQTQGHLGDLNGFIEESISGQKVIKSFSQEEQVITTFKDKSNNLKKTAFWAQTYSGFIPKVMNFLNNMSFTIIAAIGGLLAIKGFVSIGTMVIFTEYSRQFTRPINDLANQFNTLLSAVAGAERVFDVLDEKCEEEKDVANEIHELKGEVHFQNASFSYENGEKTIKNVSFHVAEGETVALVGPTGAGKTTIINLLARFYDLENGKITLDGTNIVELKRESLRQQMGFVLQESFLFEGTIRENIRYGKFDASDEEVISAAKDANAHSFIMKLPDKYDTILKQDGSGISQGQKQLLSIARAILANPSLLLLDEATSSIDTVTEVKIQEALARLMEGRTSFVIAHRLNTVRNADQILVLNSGEVIEQGAHDVLIKNRGFYADLYESQFKKERFV